MTAFQRLDFTARDVMDAAVWAADQQQTDGAGPERAAALASPGAVMAIALPAGAVIRCAFDVRRRGSGARPQAV